MIERGERVAHVETLAALAEALDVPLAELFSGIDGAMSGPPDLLRPLSDFCRSRRLNARDVEKLLGVARAMFNAKG
jgi:hypothetical protein